jgi:hypothetical protein
MKRRKDYRKKQGHRQNLTKVKIESIRFMAHKKAGGSSLETEETLSPKTWS